MTLEKIASLAGVSRSTVSRVINEQPNVKEDVRERVLQVIREQNFYPNNAARALVNRRTQIIGLVIPQAIHSIFADPYFPILIQGIAAACNDRGYYLMLSLVTDHIVDAYRRIIKGGHLDGVILASTFTDDLSFISRLQADDFPFVLVGRQPQCPAVTSVDTDNTHGATMAVQHLARLNHTRLATITGPLSMTAAIDRREGFLRGLRAARLPIHEAYIIEGDFTESGGYEAAQRLLALPERPQAIFAASDIMAMGAIKAIRAAGLHVPDDVAVIGFDDIPFASALEPPLTTIRQPIEQLGYNAAAILIERLTTSNEPHAPQRVVLPTELVVRGSCGYARAHNSGAHPLPARG